MQSNITDPTPRYAPPLPYDGRGAAALSTHASKSYAMSPHGTPSLWEGRGGLPDRMAFPSHCRGGVERSEGWGQ